MCLDDVALAHVTHPEHETRSPVPVADDSIPREQQSLGALFRSRQFRKHNAHHKCLNEHAHNTLQAHDEDRLGTLFRNEAVPVTNCVLSLHGEQEARREPEDLGYARREFRYITTTTTTTNHTTTITTATMPFPLHEIEITVRVRDQPPDYPEHRPRKQEAQRENQQRPPPLSIHQCGENILHVPPAPFRHVSLNHIAVPVLEDHALSHTP